MEHVRGIPRLGRSSLVIVSCVTALLATGCKRVVRTVYTEAAADVGAGAPAAAVPEPASGLRRLTRREYIATLRAMLPASAFPTVEAELWRLPEDVSRDGFDTMDRRVTADHVEAWFRIAEVASRAVRDAWRPALGDTCDAGAAACAQALADAIGRKAFRRSLTSEETARLEVAYAEAANDAAGDPVGSGLEAAAFALLNAPELHYRLELGAGPTTREVTAVELATRLALALTGEPPSDALLSDATAVETLEAAADALLSTPAARERVLTFFSGWLALPFIPQLQYPNEFFPMASVPGLRDALLREVHAVLLAHALDRPKATYADLMTTRAGTYESEPQAGLYGVVVNQPLGTPLELDAGTRTGLLTRAGLLVQLGEYTSPIRRGAFVRRRLLCDELEIPPPSVLPQDKRNGPAQDPNKTARERWTAATADEPCRSCHESFNALGFVLERYDALGRRRETEYTASVLSPNGKQLSIDDTATVTLDADPVTVTGATGLGKALAASPKAHRCFATQWFRFVMGRRETTQDSDSLDTLTAALTSDGIRAMFARTVTMRAFRERP